MVGPDWDWWLPGILDQVCYLLRWVVYLSWTKRKGKRKYQLYLYVSPCKVIWIPESGKFLLVESAITGNICLWNPQSGILGFKIRSPAQEIQNPANDWNPEYKFCWQGIWYSVPGIRNRQCGIQNSRLYWITWHGASYDIARLKHIISNCNQFLFCFQFVS